MSYPTCPQKTMMLSATSISGPKALGSGWVKNGEYWTCPLSHYMCKQDDNNYFCEPPTTPGYQVLDGRVATHVMGQALGSGWTNNICNGAERELGVQYIAPNEWCNDPNTDNTEKKKLSPIQQQQQQQQSKAKMATNCASHQLYSASANKNKMFLANSAWSTEQPNKSTLKVGFDAQRYGMTVKNWDSGLRVPARRPFLGPEVFNGGCVSLTSKSTSPQYVMSKQTTNMYNSLFFQPNDPFVVQSKC